MSTPLFRLQCSNPWHQTAVIRVMGYVVASQLMSFCYNADWAIARSTNYRRHLIVHNRPQNRPKRIRISTSTPVSYRWRCLPERYCFLRNVFWKFLLVDDRVRDLIRARLQISTSDRPKLLPFSLLGVHLLVRLGRHQQSVLRCTPTTEVWLRW